MNIRQVRKERVPLTAATMDDMSVVADLTEIGKRVNSSNTGAPTAGETPKSGGIVGEG